MILIILGTSYLKQRIDEKSGIFNVTRKYPLRGHILGVLTHTTALDRHWGRDETLAGCCLAQQQSDWASGTLTMWF